MMTFNNITSQNMYVSYRPFLTRVACITQLPAENNNSLASCPQSKWQLLKQTIITGDNPAYLKQHDYHE